MITPEEYNERLTNLHGLISGDLAGGTIAISGAELLLSIKDRITNEGRNSSGGPIGSYSIKPMYADKDKFVKPGAFNPQGKRVNEFGVTYGDHIVPAQRLKQNNVKRNPTRYQRYTAVKPDLTVRKTMYLDEGYKELRGIQGLRVDIVNFKYRGDLISSYQSQRDAQMVLLGLTTDLSAKKREGLEAKFGRTYYATEDEIQKYISRTNYLLERLTRDTIEGHYVTAAIS